MASFVPLLPLLLGAMTPSALAMARDCAPTPPAPEGSVPWVQSLPLGLQDQFSSALLSPNGRQLPLRTLDGGPKQPLEATGEGEDPAFCPLAPG